MGNNQSAAALPGMIRNHAAKHGKSEFSKMREWENQVQKSVDFKTALLNPVKNRYANILANESTRVKLTSDEQYYINANYISDDHQQVLYIAGQGPLPNTIYDFWRMIIEEDVKVILMLANVIEKNSKKCEQYWTDLGEQGIISSNDSSSKEKRQIKVSNIEEDVIKNEIVDRTIKVGFHDNDVNGGSGSGGEEKTVHLVHMKTWPDFGVPNLDTFSEVVYLVNRLNTGGSKIYVHCSAGVGRTGTFCLVHSILKDYQNNCNTGGQDGGDITPRKIMKRAVSLKEQRFGMIQTSEQYLFAYQAISHIMEQECVNKQVL